MRSESKQKIAGVLRFAWYLCASVLILSLPTFSYLLPRHEASPYFDRGGRAGMDSASGPARGVSGEEGGFSALVRGALASFSGTVGDSVADDAADVDAGSREASPNLAGRRPAGDSAAPRTWQPPRRFEQRRSRVAPTDAGELQGAADPRLESGLSDLQQGYEEAFNSLFSDVFFGVRAAGNPFENALDPGGSNPPPSDAGPTDSGTAANPPGDAGSDSSGGSPNPSGDTGQGSDPGGSGGAETADPTGPKDPGYSFLVVGDFVGDGSNPGISRARLDDNGQFVLENASRFTVFPGIVHSLLTFEETEKVIIEDIEGDGDLDFVVATEVPAVGTAIESYVQIFPGQFQLTGTAFLYLQEIRSFALFDFNRDGKDELALALADHPHLTVLEHVGSEWLYLREIALPFQPALVMSSPVAVGVRTRSLFVLDDGLEHVLSSTDRQPEAFRFGSSLPLNHLRRIPVNLSGRYDDPGEVAVFGLPNRLVVCEGRGRGMRSFASIRLIAGSPLMIIGDYARTATRQTLWLP